MPLRERVGRVRTWALDLLVERPGDPVWLRSLRAHLDVEFRDRVLMLAGQAFIAIVPLLVVGATLATSADGDGVATYLIDKFGLTGISAETMHTLFTRPPEVVSGTSVLSLGVVLFSVNSFSRNLRRTVDRAWRLPYLGFRGAPYGVLGVLLIVGASVAVSWLASIASDAGLARSCSSCSSSAWPSWPGRWCSTSCSPAGFPSPRCGRVPSTAPSPSRRPGGAPGSTCPA